MNRYFPKQIGKTTRGRLVASSYNILIDKCTYIHVLINIHDINGILFTFALIYLFYHNNVFSDTYLGKVRYHIVYPLCCHQGKSGRHYWEPDYHSFVYETGYHHHNLLRIGPIPAILTIDRSL